MTDLLDIIRESYEEWYNKTVATSPTTIAINYSDLQTFSIRAFHTVSVEVYAISIREHLSYATRILTLKENYNHGLMSESEAKEGLLKKLLIKLYSGITL